jgi:hypothetical protein
MAVIPAPLGWPNIKTAYQHLRDKLNEGRTTKVSNSTLIATTNYWLARLRQDRAFVDQGTPKKDIPDPAGWPSVRATYDTSITAKLASAAAENASKDAQLAAIDYWIARLRQDQECIQNNVEFVVYPQP